MFSNPQTAAQYQPVEGFEHDRQVTLVGKFSKPLSQVSPEEAAQLIDNGVNYIRTVVATGSPAHVQELPAAPEPPAGLAEMAKAIDEALASTDKGKKPKP